jgi:uncharacterized protein
MKDFLFLFLFLFLCLVFRRRCCARGLGLLDRTSLLMDNALSVLFQAENADDVEQALAKGESIESRNQKDTPLIFAASNGHLDVVDCLLRHNADVKVKNQQGRTALIVACHQGHTDVVNRMIQEKEVDINETTETSSALIEAC